MERNARRTKYLLQVGDVNPNQGLMALLNALIFKAVIWEWVSSADSYIYIYIYQMMLTRFVEHRTDSISAGKLQPNEMINICRETDYTWNEMLGEHSIHNRLQPVSNSDIENVTSRGPNQLRGHYLMLGYIMQCDLRWSSLFFRFKESAIHVTICRTRTWNVQWRVRELGLDAHVTLPLIICAY